VRRKQPSEAPPAGPANSPKSPDSRVYREIDTALILDPLNPARETFGESKLQELIDSIREVGLIEPLVGEMEGENFRVHAGHRRLIACRALEFKTVPCLVFPPGQVPGDALKAHENLFREDLNPGEEATYLQGVLETIGQGDIDILASKLHLTRNYIDGRLVLLRGDPRVLQALKDNAISVGVAHELNKVVDAAVRFMYLDAAMQGGASVRMVRDWRTRANAQTTLAGTEFAPAQPQGAADQVPPIDHMVCFLCQDGEDKWEMELLYTHKRCRKIILDRFLSQMRGEGNTNGPGV
jgi:ParB family chromosome partitioning protein